LTFHQWTRRWNGLEAASIPKRLLTGAFWNGVGSIGVRILGLAVSILLARLLGKEGFGEYGMVVSTLGTFGPLAALNQTSTASVYVATHREKDPVRTGRVIRQVLEVTLLAGTATGAAIFLSAPALSAGLLKDPGLLGSLRWCGLLVLLTALNGVLTGVLSGFEEFRDQSLLGILFTLLSLPLMLGGAKWFGLSGVFAGSALGQLLLAGAYGACLLQLLARRGIHLQGGWGPEWKEVMGFSLVNLAATMVGGPAFWLSNALLVNQAGGYGQMGLYQAANQWHTAILTLPAVIAATSLPILAHSKGRQGDFTRAVRYNLLSTALVSAAGALLVVALSGPILAAYGPGFRDGLGVLALMAAAGVARSLFTSLNQVILSVHRAGTNLGVNLLIALLMVGFSALWVPRHLALGLAGAYLASYVLSTAWAAWEVRRILEGQAPAPSGERGSP
jgi:O-antigen/teichoic acid export membrane protein